MACNKIGDDIAHWQLFAIKRSRFYADYMAQAKEDEPLVATPFMINLDFVGNGFGWNMSGTGGNQRYNGVVEVWHSTYFDFDLWHRATFIGHHMDGMGQLQTCL